MPLQKKQLQEKIVLAKSLGGTSIEQQTAKESTDFIASAKDLECPICFTLKLEDLSIVEIKNCGHTLCKDCLEKISNVGNDQHGGMTKCPLCRAEFNVEEITSKFDNSLKDEYLLRCDECEEVHKLPLFSDHQCKSHAPEKLETIENFVPDMSKVGVNRSTFSCPLCPAKNLTRKDLVSHVGESHRNSAPAVCPICLTYPYGDPNYTTYLPGHLKMRHNFDLEEIGWATHFNEDEAEDEVLSKIIELSKTQQ